MSKRAKNKIAELRKPTPSTMSSPAIVFAAEPVAPRLAIQAGVAASSQESPQLPCVALTGMSGPALDYLASLLHAPSVAGFGASHGHAPIVSRAAPLSEIEAALEKAERHIIAMYLSPWDAVLEVSQEELSGYLPGWLNYHSGLLRLRQKFAGRMLLVNGNRLDDSAQLLVEKIRSICGDSAPYDGLATDTRGIVVNRNTVLRAKSFEWIAPDYWEVYEALESCAWLGNGEPEYRDSLPALEAADLSEFVLEWHRALSLPAQLEESQGQLKAQSDRTAIIEGELIESRSEADALRRQLSELKSQYEELRAAFSHQAEETLVRVAASEAESSALRDRLAESETSLLRQREETKERERELQAAGERVRESDSENGLLLAQLHNIQESLESTFIQGQEASRSAAEERTQLEQAKAVLTVQVAKLQNEIVRAEEINEALSQEKSAFSSALSNLQSDKAKAEEAVKLLTAEKASLFAQATQASADLKAITAEAEKQRATAQAEKAKLAEEMAKSAKLQNSLVAAGQLEAGLRANVGVLETRIREAESESELLLQQLHQVQEELEHYYLRSEQLAKVLLESTASFNRARRVVAQMVKLQA